MAGPTVDEVRSAGLAAGLVAVGITDTAPLLEARATLVERKAAGLHGGMQFTYRNPERATDPGRLLPGARSLVVGAHPYAGGPVDPAPVGADGWSEPQGRVARYATVDHYADLLAALRVIAELLESHGHRTRVVADDNALVDRAVAQRAGVGWFGRNANVLVPDHGSWVVLGTVVTDAELTPSEPVADGCGSCRRCLDGCPTGAIVDAGVVDARRCLAWLVQAEGPIPVEFREALGDRLYGCDDCQEVCPPSRRGVEGEVRVPAAGAWVGLVDLLSAGDDELMARHGRWYVPRRDPRYLRRNALVALGNTAEPGDERARAVLVRYADGDDTLLAEHARWGLRRVAERVGA
jgi:epoxyqueuosine reductase